MCVLVVTLSKRGLIETIAQLAGAVEYTDYFTAEEPDLPNHPMSVLVMTLNNLMVRLQ